MRKTLQVMTTAAMLTLTTLPLSAAIYMKVEGVDGRATAAGREKWIELGSIQFLTAGSAKGTMNQQSGRLCASRGALPTVAVEINGESHSLRDVQFSDCQTAGETTTFTMAFSGCATHAGARDYHIGGGTYSSQRAPLPKTYDHTLGGGSFAANAKLTAGAAPVAIQLESLTLNGNGAKLALIKELPGTLILSARQKLPSLTVELTSGQKWTFYEVELEDVLITSATSHPTSARPKDSLSLTFAKVDGPLAGFQAHR